MLLERSIAVVVPAWNEGRHIGRVISSMPAFVDQVIVVDDHSDDDTVAQALAAGDSRLVLFRHETNRGVGAAIASGYARAFRQGADVAVVMAGDGQMDVRDLPSLVGAVGAGAGYAKGNRLAWPGVWRRMPLDRLVGNYALSWLTRQVTGLHVSDSQCGYTALSRRAAERIDYESLWPRYGYPNDLLCRLAECGERVAEVAVRPIYADESSGVTVRDAVWVVPGVLARAWWRRRSASRGPAEA